MTGPWQIQMSSSAARRLRKLDPPVQKRIGSLIDSLVSEPRPPGCLKLTGTRNLWRVRTGDYRVIYEIKDTQLIIVVVDLGHRGDIYDGI